MKKLSVVIVNYNVSHFLEQCLLSVQSACKGIDAEVFVVDNNSVDGSVAMIREKFAWVSLIANTENVGFSKANNQAIRISQGEYVLLLNPDTVIEEDTFRKCISFMDDHPDGGGLGVYMVDGKGSYLPESKRSMPTPSVAFYKIFGLSVLFPRSKRFGRYHLGYLDKNQTHEVEVLSGAFMMLRRSVLEITGYLDESFFMYGEDIDLSYRIIKAGFRNYYFPGTRIIHYKGESTRKSSLNYVFVFYQAMIIFARKHFTGKNARLLSLMIHFAVYFRAAIAIAKRTLNRLMTPLTDAALIWGGIFIIKNYWASHVRFGIGSDYPIELMFIAVPVYTLIWITSMFFSGVYDRPYVMNKIWKGMGAGTIIILVAYALLPESMRFSRALIILGFFWASLALPFYRHLLGLIGLTTFRQDTGKLYRIAIIGSTDESERVAEIVRKSRPDVGFIGIVGIHPDNLKRNNIGNISQISEIVAVYKISELIFCLKDIEASEIIQLMTTPLEGSPEFKIAPPESSLLIGSGSLGSTGEIQLLQFNTIGSKSNRRNKRFLDLLSSLILIILSPLLFPLQINPLGFLRNATSVIRGARSWVGYHTSGSKEDKNLQLPSIRNGVFGPADGIKTTIDNDQMLQELNLIYARDYRMLTDLRIIFKNIRNLGRL